MIHQNGDYLYSTVAFSGTALHKTCICPVAELIEKSKDPNLNYDGVYSMTTSGGDFSDYITRKDGAIITNLQPGLGFALDGRPSGQGIFALLPETKLRPAPSAAKIVTTIDVRLTYEDDRAQNPFGEQIIRISGKGMRADCTFSIKELENCPELQVTGAEQHAFSLYGLLRKKELLELFSK